jgi:hypothetical protein
LVDDIRGVIIGWPLPLKGQLLGFETVPVHIAKGLTPAQIKAYRIADNQTARLLAAASSRRC